MTHAPYDADFYTWTQLQAAVLRAKDLAALCRAGRLSGLGLSSRPQSHRQRNRPPADDPPRDLSLEPGPTPG